MASEPSTEIRTATVLIVDIASTVGLRTRLGEAAAERRIRGLIDAIIALCRARGGQFIKSYGDDVLAAFDGDRVGAAAEAAMAAQREATRAGLQLYAGLHVGPVEFRITMGHPDAVGLTVSIAARLHKLTEGAPGRIFLLAEAVERLPFELRGRASPYGSRDIKGVGPSAIWTLDWQDLPTTPWTVFVDDAVSPQAVGLTLSHGDRRLELVPGRGAISIGRSRDSGLCLPDLELRISSLHLMIDHVDGRWFVQDISRNGTWMRDGRSEAVASLPPTTKVPLPPSGALCLGRAFASDGDGRFTVRFEQSRAEAG